MPSARSQRQWLWLLGLTVGCAGGSASPGSSAAHPSPDGPAMELFSKAGQYTPQEPDSVRFYYTVRYYQLPPLTPRLARMETRHPASSADEDREITEFRGVVAARGANAIVSEEAKGRTVFVAVFLDVESLERAQAIQYGYAAAADSTDISPSYSPSAGPSSAGGGPVQVRGYRRKDGTYVRPHTRSRPRH